MKINNYKLWSNDEVIIKIVGEVLRAFHLEVEESAETPDFDEFEIKPEIDGEKVTVTLTASCGGSEKIFKFSEKILVLS